MKQLDFNLLCSHIHLWNQTYVFWFLLPFINSLFSLVYLLLFSLFFINSLVGSLFSFWFWNITPICYYLNLILSHILPKLLVLDLQPSKIGISISTKALSTIMLVCSALSGFATVLTVNVYQGMTLVEAIEPCLDLEWETMLTVCCEGLSLGKGVPFSSKGVRCLNRHSLVFQLSCLGT